MTVIGISMAMNNADIIRANIENMLTQVDHVIVSDNGSTDGAREILETLPVTLLDDPDPAYYQSRKMTNLANIAHSMGADWIVPFDSDEIWYSPFGSIKDVIEELAPQWFTASAAIYDHVSSAYDPDEPNPVYRIGWRRTYPLPLHKVACRYREDLIIKDGNHGAWYDGGTTIYPGLLIIRHFPYRTPNQFINKVRVGAAAYAVTDLEDASGSHWKDYGRLLQEGGEDTLKEVFHTWFYLVDPFNTEDIIYDPAPIE